MKNINKMALAIIFCSLALPGIFSPAIRLIPNDFQPSLDLSQKVYRDASISQTFIGESNGLSGIGVSIKNPNLINKKDISLSLYQNENLLRRITLNGRSIGDGNFVKFIFDPIEDSKGKMYHAVFAAPDTEASEALEIFLTKNPTGESLSDVIFYRPDNPIFLAFNIYGNWFKKLMADLPFLVFYVTVLLGLGCLVFKPSKQISR